MKDLISGNVEMGLLFQRIKYIIISQSFGLNRSLPPIKRSTYVLKYMLQNKGYAGTYLSKTDGGFCAFLFLRERKNTVPKMSSLICEAICNLPWTYIYLKFK